jgi:hypothetical protein
MSTIVPGAATTDGVPTAELRREAAAVEVLEPPRLMPTAGLRSFLSRRPDGRLCPCSLCNQKAASGKTTTTITRCGLPSRPRVLSDLDPQGACRSAWREPARARFLDCLQPAHAARHLLDDVLLQNQVARPVPATSTCRRLSPAGLRWLQADARPGPRPDPGEYDVVPSTASRPSACSRSTRWQPPTA